jgi:hypothetical protein
MHVGKLNCRVKTNPKFPADAGFPCDKVPVTAAVQEHDKINTLYFVRATEFY